MMKTALIFGISGQDGSYLSEILLQKGYHVWGMIRPSSTFNPQNNGNHMLNFRYGDLTDSASICEILNEIENTRPDLIEIYNLASQSHVHMSFKMPYYTGQVDTIGTLNILEAIRKSPRKFNIKFYQASTSGLFGKAEQVPQSEATPFNPKSPYAIAKMYSHYMVNHYRETYQIYACNGILFNHSSPRRPENFILKKITSGVKKLLNDQSFVLELGNLNVKRDIGYAKEYCEGMWMMLQQKVPSDYVLATGSAYSVRELFEKCCKYHNINVEWVGLGINERGYDRETGRLLVKVNQKYFRPVDVDVLVGDSLKAELVLNWKPKTTIDDLIKLMMEDE